MIAVMAPLQVRRRVALLVETSNRYARGLLMGIGQFARREATWTMSLVERGRGQRTLAALRGFDGDGIIARIDHPLLMRAIADAKLPTVDLCGERMLPTVPWVETDDQALVTLALDHLCERGIQQIAFIGDRQYAWSRLRRRHVIAAAKQRRLPWRCHDLHDPTLTLETFLRNLPTPCGVLCSYDLIGLQVLEAARSVGMRIPQDLAVLGIDADEAVGALCSPSLSTIALDAVGAGTAAARLLSRMMAGHAPSTLGHLLPPIGLIARASTSGFSSEDAVVQSAMAALQKHAERGLPIRTVARMAGVSTRQLSNRFQAALGQAPHAVMVRLRLQAIARRLADSDETLRTIAASCGFINPEYLHVFVKRETGLTPGAWRRLLRSNRIDGIPTT